MIELKLSKRLIRDQFLGTLKLNEDHNEEYAALMTNTGTGNTSQLGLDCLISER